MVSLSEFDFTDAQRVPTHPELLALLQSLRSQADVLIDTSGRSRQGRELLFCAIGTGAKVIGVTSGAHADEPVGIATSANLIRELTSKDRHQSLLSEFTFAIFPMLDPDGSALNERWANDCSYRSYFLHHYRNNQPAEDCEHGIPIAEGQEIRPEVAFFKRNIDRYKSRIQFYVTLHTTHVLGGSLFVVDREFQDQRIIAGLSRLCADLDLPVWDYKPEGDATLTYIAPGFIGAPSVSSYAEEYKNSPSLLAMLRMSTYEYVLRHCGGHFGLISELPMQIASGDVVSLAKSEIPAVEVKRRMLENLRIVHEQQSLDLKMIEQFDPDPQNPWLRSASFASGMMPERIANDEANLEKLTGLKADVCDVASVEKLMPLERELNRHRLFIKALERNAKAAHLVQEHQLAFDSLFPKYTHTYGLSPVPILKQVMIQTGMILQGLLSLGQAASLRVSI
jgi:hypothetical protein